MVSIGKVDPFKPTGFPTEFGLPKETVKAELFFHLPESSGIQEVKNSIVPAQANLTYLAYKLSRENMRPTAEQIQRLVTNLYALLAHALRKESL